MKSLIILCSLALVVSADNLCSRGESHWCSDIRVAKQCGAIQHCTDTVWKNTVPAKDSSDVCQFCKVVVQEVRSLLSDKKTQQEIQKYMESACAVIPDAQIAANCKDIVDNYLPEAIQLVEMFADPATVCNALGICTGFKDRVSYAGDALKAEPICADCKKFVGDIRDLITDKTTEDEVKALFKSQLCNVLGLLADQCNQLVDAYTPELLKLLSQQVEPEVVCGALGVCNGNRGLLATMRIQKSPLYAQASKMSSDVTCIACKTLLTDLQLIARDPAIQIDLQTFLNNNLCEKLGTLKQTCLDTVKLYSKTIIELIVNEMEPNERCKAFGFCAATATSVASAPLARVTLEKSESVVKVMAGMKSHVSPQCVLCEFVVKELDTLIADNATEEEIIKALDSVCSIMPDTVKKECEDFVNTYGKAILELLKSELDPQQVCTALGLCTEATVAVHPMPMLLFQGQPKASIGAKDGETCAICETVMAYVTSMIKENATEAEIEQLLDKVCNYLPKSMQTECLALIDQYGKQIIEMILKEATPKEICTMLGLCSSAAAPAPHQPAAMPLLGAKPCTRGPEYWCSSKEAANECKMMVYCQRTAWRQN